MAQRVTLDDDMMRARLRSYQSMSTPEYIRRPAQHSRVVLQDVRGVMAQHQRAAAPVPDTVSPSVLRAVVQQPQSPPPVTLLQPQSATPPAAPELDTTHSRPLAVAPSSRTAPSTVLVRSFSPPAKPIGRWQKVLRVASSLPGRYLRRPQLNQSTMLSGLALLLFVVGAGVSLTGFRTNSTAQAAIAKAAHASNTSTTTGGDSTPPNTTPVTLSDIKKYHVAPDEARYITIPKIGVFARVLVTGTTKTGALGTPTNVFDTARYSGSAKPGQPGATLIDGHVSSWTTNGVFYDIKKLVAGDNIEIQKGDGTTLNYTVVQTIVYDVSKVDMNALMRPAAGATTGLNLITCGGKYDTKSGQFTQRVAVFATLE